MKVMIIRIFINIYKHILCYLTNTTNTCRMRNHLVYRINKEKCIMIPSRELKSNLRYTIMINRQDLLLLN